MSGGSLMFLNVVFGLALAGLKAYSEVEQWCGLPAVAEGWMPLFPVLDSGNQCSVHPSQQRVLDR